jgi:hypothetical protein
MARKADELAQDPNSVAGKIKARRDENQARLDAIMKSMSTPDESENVHNDREENGEAKGHY